jgi:putative hydrolase of the HAD superfamily
VPAVRQKFHLSPCAEFRDRLSHGIRLFHLIEEGILWQKETTQLRAIFFDVDGVLVHGYHAHFGNRNRWDQHLEVDFGVHPDLFRDVFIKGPLESEGLTGRTSILNALDQCSGALKIKGAEIALIKYWLERDSMVSSGLLKLLWRLKENHHCKLYIATNQEHVRAFYLWANLGFGELFDDIFYSARLGLMKPSRGFFERISEHIVAETERPLLFDDSTAVVEAANEFGWEAVLYRDIDDCASHPWIRRHVAPET